MAKKEDLLKDLKKKTMVFGATGVNYTPTLPTAQQMLMASKPTTAVSVPKVADVATSIKKPTVAKPINPLDDDALRLNMANNRTEPTAVMKALSFVGNNIYNGTIRPIGQAIDKQYERLDDYDFGRNALESAHATNVGQAQNVWDEDLLRTQRLINNRNELLSYMTPVQKLQYESLPDNKKKDYLDIIMRQLQTKKGAQRAEEIRNIDDATTKNLQKLMLSFESGGNSAKSGLKGAYNLLRGADETVAKDASEYAFEQLRPETTGAMGVVMDLANTTGRMAPTMAAGLIGAPLGLGAVGTVGMGVSSAGSGYDTAIGQGYTPEQAAAYGVASGIKEAALQRIVGALPGVSGAEGAITKALGKYSDDVLGKIINNPAIASAVTRVVGNALSEGTEEAMQEILDTGLRNVLLGENNEVDWGNVAYSGALGALTGGAFAVPNAVGTYQNKKIGLDTLPSNGLQSPDLGAEPDPINIIGGKSAKINTPVEDAKKAGAASTNFNQNTVGSAAYNPEGLQAKVDEYGAIPQGEGPVARVSQIPVKIDDSGAKTSKFTRTAVEAEATTDEMASEIEQGVLKGDFRYIPTTNKELADNATKRIEKMGFESALKGWDDKVENNVILTADDIAIAEQLYNASVNAGDTKTAYKIIGDLSAYGSMYGQAIEALRILKTLGPDARLYHVEGVKNLLNKEIGLGKLKAINKDLGVTLNEELVDKMMKAETEAEAEEYMEAIKQDMANQVDIGLYELVQEFRYLMMLANPTTHIRNIVGNAIMQPAVRVKDAIGAGLETVGRTDKTKSVIKNKDAKEFAKADYEAIKNNFKNDNKYSMYNDILRKRTVFKNVTPLEKLRVANSGALSAEDNFFKGITYRNALAGYMTANNHTADYYNSPEGASDLAKAREYAMNEALKATYQDASKLANTLNKFEKDSIAGKVFIGGLLPFKKTPVNILKRGVEYSPAGLLKLANDINSAKKNGNPMTPDQIVDSVSASLTGTGIMALGMFLKSIGALSGAYDEDEEIARLQKAQGKQEYALNIGDKSFDLSQFSPTAMPLLVGAQLQDLIEGEGWDFAETLDVLMRVADPIVETSMLSGLADAINTYNFGASNTSAVSSIIGSSIKNYATSFLPTVGGKVAKTVDPVLRSTYVDKNSSLPKSVQEMLMSMQYKTPGAYSKLEPNLDIWGRETVNDSLASRVLNNFINPSTTKNVNETAVDKEVQRVYEQTGTTGVIPKKPDKYTTYKGERKDYTAEEYTQLVKGKNAQSFTDLEEMFKNPLYDQLSDDAKADAIKDVYAYNGIKAKEKLGGYSSDDDKKIDELKGYGMSTAQAVLLQSSLSDISNNDDLEANEKRAEKIGAIKESDVPKNKQGQLILAQGTEVCQETYPYVKSAFTEEQWVRVYDAVSSGSEQVKIGNLQVLGYSYSEAKQILSIYKSAKTKRDKAKK